MESTHILDPVSMGLRASGLLQASVFHSAREAVAGSATASRGVAFSPQQRYNDATVLNKRSVRVGNLRAIFLLSPLLVLGAPAAESATVEGVVHEPGNLSAIIAGARVTLFIPGLGYFREYRTGSQGTYTFPDVPAGIYRLGASALRRAYVEISVSVAATSIQHNFELGPETEPGSWQIVGNTLPEFFDATDIAILRADGKVFFCHNTVDPIVFDPVTGQKSFPAGSPSSQGCMNATLLADGRIIMMGGQDGDEPGSFRDAVRWVKTYSTANNSWQALADLQNPTGRWYPGLARLADGSLLVMGGGTRPSAQRTATCERFDLASETWSFTGSMVNPCEFPPSALLYTGEVLATWWPPQLYNPTTGQWRTTGNFNQPNRSWPGHSDHSIVVLADGRVLAVGVVSGPDGNSVMGEIYDPTTESWSLTSNPGLVRLQSEVVQLPDGRILVAAGETEADPPPVPDVLGVVKWTDLYDADINAWRRVADLNWFREYHAVTLLVPDGRVLITGGTRIKFQVGPTSADIEAYVPPYMLRGPRPRIASTVPSQVRRGEVLNFMLAPTMELTTVVLMGTATTTHWVSAGIPRRLVLTPQQNGNAVSVSLPVDASLLPLGHYIIFAMVDDIPSEGIILRVDAAFGDRDSDGDVDLKDYASFADCMSGPGRVPDPPPPLSAEVCFDAFDSNRDGDVDCSDFASLQAGFMP